MNGMAFANVPRLVLVELRGNVCVNKLFKTEREPIIFRRKISKNCASADVTRKEISCSAAIDCHEDYNHVQMHLYNRTLRCCKIEYGTYIDSPDYTFIADKNYNKLEGVTIMDQQTVEFLPILVHERFPILKFYSVVNTAVQRISKKNFEKMYELGFLYMEDNQIEVVRSDTFEDLIRLKIIYMGIIFSFAKLL